ncbi:MAG: sialidase family protein, partial [bacterium]
VLKGTSVHVAYQENALNGSGNRHLFHAAGFGNTFGSSLEVVSSIQDAGQPDIAADSAGNLYVAYIRGSTSDRIDMTSSADDGVNWAPSTMVSEGGTAGYHQYSPDIAVDSLDNLHFVWHEYNATTLEPGRVQYRRLDFDAEWHATEFLTPDTDKSAFASIAADPTSNNLAIVYQRYTGVQYEIFYQLGLYIPPP